MSYAALLSTVGTAAAQPLRCRSPEMRSKKQALVKFHRKLVLAEKQRKVSLVWGTEETNPMKEKLHLLLSYLKPEVN